MNKIPGKDINHPLLTIILIKLKMKLPVERTGRVLRRSLESIRISGFPKRAWQKWSMRI